MTSNTYGVVLLVIISAYIAGSALWFRLVAPYLHRREEKQRQKRKLVARKNQEEFYEKEKEKADRHAQNYGMGARRMMGIDPASGGDRTGYELRNNAGESLALTVSESREMVGGTDTVEVNHGAVDADAVIVSNNLTNAEDMLSAAQERLSAIEDRVRQSMHVPSVSFAGTRTGRWSSTDKIAAIRTELDPVKEPLDFSKLSRRIRVKKE